MAAVWTSGTQCQRGDGETPETFTTVANVANINGVDLSRNTEDVTADDSPDGVLALAGGGRS